MDFTRAPKKNFYLPAAFTGRLESGIRDGWIHA